MYPLFLKLSGQACLVIGGGQIARRKTESLLDAGAKITLISPDLTDELKLLVHDNSIDYKKRLFHEGDARGYFLIIAATNKRLVNEIVYREALESQSLINCVDDPDYCNFYVPALVKRGHLKIAISTEGKLPMMAGRIGRLIDSLFPKNIGEKLEDLGKRRRDIIKEVGDDEFEKKKRIEEELNPTLDLLLDGVGR